MPQKRSCTTSSNSASSSESSASECGSLIKSVMKLKLSSESSNGNQKASVIGNVAKRGGRSQKVSFHDIEEKTKLNLVQGSEAEKQDFRLSGRRHVSYESTGPGP